MTPAGRKRRVTPGTLTGLAVLSLLLTAFSAWAYCLSAQGIFLTLSITWATVSYHLGARLLVGWLFQAWMGNRADCSRLWYQPRPWESRLYQRLKVRRWKGKMPAYRPESFSPALHTWDEIAQAMCQSELVHETGMLLSFCPLLAAKWAGAFPVFLATSVAAAAFDLSFVILQRYNRPRVLALALRKKRGASLGHARRRKEDIT